MRDNFVDLPTDCPQRDERLGWSGDIQVFAPTATYLYDCTRRARRTGCATSPPSRRSSARCMNFHPWIECGFPSDPAAAWGDAAVIVPWELYRSTGDVGILARSVRRACARGSSRCTPSPAGPGTGAPASSSATGSIPRRRPTARAIRGPIPASWPRPTTPGPRVSAAEAAHLLGDDGCRSRPRPHRRRVRSRRSGTHYVSPAGLRRQRHRDRTRRWRSCSTCCGMTLSGGRRAHVWPNSSGRAITGSRPGSSARRSSATRWRPRAILDYRVPPAPADGDAVVAVPRHDGGDDGLGAVGQHAPGRLGQPGRDDVVQPLRARAPSPTSCTGSSAGSQLVEPGWSRVRIAPQPGGGLESASTAHLSPFGLIGVQWRRADGRLVVEVEVPRGRHRGGRAPLCAGRAYRGRRGDAPVRMRLSTRRRGPAAPAPLEHPQSRGASADDRSGCAVNDTTAAEQGLTLEQAASLLSGADMDSTRDLPAHGVPSVKMTDGSERTGDEPARTSQARSPATCFPTLVGDGRDVGSRPGRPRRARRSPSTRATPARRFCWPPA